MPDSQITIELDDSNARSHYADVAQVKASRDGFMLLFGRRRPGRQDKNAHRVPLEMLINLNPVAAKRLSIQLDAVIRQYETKFGLLQGKMLRQQKLEPTPPMPTPVFRSAGGTEKADLLFRFLEAHQAKPAFERSWGFLSRKLHANRFLLGFEKKRIGSNPAEKIAAVCRRIEMPEDFLAVFLKNLPGAGIVGFGFAEDGDACMVKAYLELGAPFYRAGGTLHKSEPYLSHLGLKWDADDSSRKALARYTCVPGCDFREVQKRLSDGFYNGTSENPLGIINGILNLAASRGGRQQFDYLDVTEEKNPRSSYDINLYGATLQLNEIHSFLLDICRYYRISEKQFGNRYEQAKNHILGHIAGGRDRNGKDFLTLYFGE